LLSSGARKWAHRRDRGSRCVLLFTRCRWFVLRTRAMWLFARGALTAEQQRHDESNFLVRQSARKGRRDPYDPCHGAYKEQAQTATVGLRRANFDDSIVWRCIAYPRYSECHGTKTLTRILPHTGSLHHKRALIGLLPVPAPASHLHSKGASRDCWRKVPIQRAFCP
jgi:hypothetical protein